MAAVHVDPERVREFEERLEPGQRRQRRALDRGGQDASARPRAGRRREARRTVGQGTATSRRSTRPYRSMTSSPVRRRAISPHSTWSKLRRSSRALRVYRPSSSLNGRSSLRDYSIGSSRAERVLRERDEDSSSSARGRSASARVLQRVRGRWMRNGTSEATGHGGARPVSAKSSPRRVERNGRACRAISARDANLLR